MTFQPFDPHGLHTRSRRNLPHWEQLGATYFVTFRLADSLPVEARARIAELRELNDSAAFAWVERFVDAGVGSCVLADVRNAQIMVSALDSFDNARYKLGAFAVMPNHVHALVRPLEGYRRSQIVHSWKSYTAHDLQRSAGIRGSVWQEEGFDRIVRDEGELKRFRDYIFANPRAANLRRGQYLIGEGTMAEQ